MISQNGDSHVIYTIVKWCHKYVTVMSFIQLQNSAMNNIGIRIISKLQNYVINNNHKGKRQSLLWQIAPNGESTATV